MCGANLAPPPHPPTQWVLGDISEEVCRPGHEETTPPRTAVIPCISKPCSRKKSNFPYTKTEEFIIDLVASKQSKIFFSFLLLILYEMEKQRQLIF